jgi:uncharacterized protein (TIGR03083 family)
VRPLDPLLLAAYEAQAALTRSWIAGADLEAPSRLAGWRGAELVAHLVASARPYAVATVAPRGARPMSLAAYVAGYGASAPEVAAREVAAAQELSREQALADFDAGIAAVLAAPTEDVVVEAPRGPVRRSDLLRTRVLELVVHSLDVEDGPARDRQAVRVCVRALVEIVAERHPGKAVEVRVPPYAAAQIGAGVTHTRGTPPNVVEMAPEVFLAVAAGRRPWSAAMAAGEVRASGSRADLTPYLPLL